MKNEVICVTPQKKSCFCVLGDLTHYSDEEVPNSKHASAGAWGGVRLSWRNDPFMDR